MCRYLAPAALAFSAVALLPSDPAAHSWYPERCCSGNDCFRADHVQRLRDGTLEISTGAVVVRIPRSFPIEASPDGKAHLCVYDSGWGFEARCVFLPAGS
jgi:hypothetical protein